MILYDPLKTINLYNCLLALYVFSPFPFLGIMMFFIKYKPKGLFGSANSILGPPMLLC